MTGQPLADVTALVTGASASIGKAVSARLHGEGARVAICARSAGPLAAAVGRSTAAQAASSGCPPTAVTPTSWRNSAPRSWTRSVR